MSDSSIEAWSASTTAGAGDASEPAASSVEASAVWPATAEALMRSRFAAFKSGDAAWLAATWHPATKPDSIELDADFRWRALQIVDVYAGGADDETGIVEFRASFVVAGAPGTLHERSRFERVDGRWMYLDGEHIE